MKQIRIQKTETKLKVASHELETRVGAENIPFAVIGIVDIVKSSKLANSNDIKTEWLVKAGFFEAANRRAAETGMVIINHTGDGFLFLANYLINDGWQGRLLRFHRLLTHDFHEIIATIGVELGDTQTGLRFGVAGGPVMLGWMGMRQCSVVGVEVNLAARLCSVADTDSMVVSSAVWRAMEPTTRSQSSSVSMKSHSTLKGFDRNVDATHITGEEESPFQDETAVRGAA